MIPEEDNKLRPLFDLFDNVSRKVRTRTEQYILFPTQRWVITAALFLIYILRIYAVGGYYVISYILGLYVLHLIVQFLTPKGIPDLEDEDDEENMQLPIHQTQENESSEPKPLTRTVSEFHFWQDATKAVIIALCTTLSRLFDLPVFWPFLLGYFIFLVAITVKRLMRRMKKYNYSIFDFGKKNMRKPDKY
eukprot:TRINITY_DN503_c0_g1_i4.p2 TRINITY_DN503_c0_g1~~TRINITY_DN503_c0_g1_i4.p2  ORF type:complete len:191 (+),score=1.09 TRINITY_DN503_c0_g1_i4:120-692(+)